jgi:hypothetical protein
LLKVSATELLLRGSRGMGPAFRRDDRSVRNPSSRQFALAAQPHPLLGFELRHPQEVAENVEPMTTGQLDQFGNGFRNEGDGLIRAALLPLWLIGLRPPISDRSLSLSAAPHLGQKSCIQIHLIWIENTLFESATLGRISQLYRYKVVHLTHPFNICRFDRGPLTTHVRLWMAGRESRGTRLNIFP